MLELTLAIAKPHVLKNLVALRGIKRLILDAQFRVVRSTRRRITLEEAATFYEEHRQKFFYDRLVSFMTSGQSELYVLAKENAIADWRRLMGPTKTYRAQFEAPLSVRGQWGLSDTRNATHGSDSPQSAEREIGLFFPEFDYEGWFRTEEPQFRLNRFKFDEQRFVHFLIEN